MRRSQRGFTLIELMIALVVSSLLVGMILAIFLRMSLAYRGQQQVSGVQQVLAAARSAIEYDAKQTGLGMSQGFTTVSNGTMLSPLKIVNSSTGPDEVTFFYADTTTQAVITAKGTNTITVDSSAGFAANDVIVLSRASTMASPVGSADAAIATFVACTSKIYSINGNIITVNPIAPWGSADFLACNVGGTQAAQAGTMVYKLVVRGYRIDPSRPTEGVLQVSPSGGLVANDYQDLAYGFTDLQVATQFYDGQGPGSNTDTADPDTDTTRDWYSSTSQQTFTAANSAGSGLNSFSPNVPLQMTITLVARTERDVEGVATGATPTLVVAGNGSNNTIGDRASVTLPSSSDTALQGNRIYRYTTFGVDLRNMGIGR